MEHAGNTDRTDAEQLQHGIPVEVLSKYLDKEIEEMTSCTEFPWAAGLFVFFLVWFNNHINPQTVHSVQNAIEQELERNVNFAYTTPVPYDSHRSGTKGLNDIMSVEDIYSWLRVGLAPRLFSEFEVKSEVPLNAWSPRAAAGLAKLLAKK